MFGSGKSEIKLTPVGSRQDLAITLPVMQPACEGTVEATRALLSSVKLPPFIAGVGTVDWTVVAFRLVKFCASKKKKVRFLITGPPMAPPNTFWLKCPRGMPFRLLKKVLASRLLLRRNSHTSP